MVFRRTCGSYGQLLDCLRSDGFVPLHYSLVWVISRFFKPVPGVLRFVPALCGTLMVPAVYFLARQLLPKRTALLAAAFTACSAFMLFYSRDAKMYMDAWLFVTLNTACLLWWFRTHRLTAWLCWIAAGCAACGIHASSGIPVAISSLLLLTQNKMRWQQVLYWLAGVILIFAGPVGYYEKFNRWQDNPGEMGQGLDQLQWVSAYNYGRTGPQLVRFLSTTMLMGWEWPKDADVSNIPPARVEWPARASELLLLIAITACLPWPRRRKSQMPVLRYSEEPDSTGQHPARRSTSEPASGVEPQWRVALWLSFWIILPVYGFYCRSMPGFATPADGYRWLVQAWPVLSHSWFWVLLSAIALLIAGMAVRVPGIRVPLFRGVLLLLVAAVVIGLCQGIGVAMAHLAEEARQTGRPWESLWVPRYLGFIWPMLAVAVAALLIRLPGRWFRVAAIVFVLGLNLGVASFRIFGQTEPPVDRMAADAMDAQNPAHHTLFWTHLRQSTFAPGGENIYGEPGQYYLQLLQNRPTDPDQFMISLGQRQDQSPGLRRMPWDRDLPAGVDRIVFWSEYTPDGRVLFGEPAIPSNWRVQSDEWFTARDYWIWQDLSKYRRMVLVKTES